MPIALINTADAAEARFTVNAGFPVTLIAYGLGSGEEVVIQGEYETDLFTDLYDYNTSEQIKLTSTGNIRPLSAPAEYKIIKAATAEIVIVGIHAA